MLRMKNEYDVVQTISDDRAATIIRANGMAT